jgi:hypothetical protein
MKVNFKFKPFGTYKRILESAKTFEKFIMYPDPLLPKEIINGMDESLVKSIGEGKERYDIFSYNKDKLITLPTERLEQMHIIDSRDRDGIYCNFEEEQKLHRSLKNEGLFIIVHHTHIFNDLPSIEDLTYPRKLDFVDISVISRPKSRLFIDVNKLKKVSEDEVCSSLDTILELASPHIFLGFIGPKIVFKRVKN